MKWIINFLVFLFVVVIGVVVFIVNVLWDFKLKEAWDVMLHIIEWSDVFKNNKEQYDDWKSCDWLYWLNNDPSTGPAYSFIKYFNENAQTWYLEAPELFRTAVGRLINAGYVKEIEETLQSVAGSEFIDVLDT